MVVTAVGFAVALIIVGEGVFASNQFMVGPAYFRLRFGRGQLVAVVIGVGLAQFRGVGPVGVYDRAGHGPGTDPPKGVVAVSELDPVGLAPLVLDRADAMGVGLPVDVTLEPVAYAAFHFVDQMRIGQIGEGKGLAVAGHPVPLSMSV